MLNKEIQHCIQLYKEGRYQINSDRNIDVDTHNVQEQIKKGRTLIICSCENHTQFCTENPICRHKLFYIIFPLLESLDARLSNLICEYSAGKSISKTEEGERLCNQIIDDLKRLK